MERIHLTKIDAARRQLQTAIDMWFFGADPVSTHSLAFSSHEIIHVLFRKGGNKELLLNVPIREGFSREEVSEFVKKAGNFFKHARNDWDKTLDFDPSLTEVFLAMSVVGLWTITGDMTDGEFAFYKWIQIHNPAWFKDGVFNEGIPIELPEQIRRMPKGEFFKAFLELRRVTRKH